MLFIAGIAIFFTGRFPQLLSRLEEPLKKDFKYSYRYGMRDARGFDDDDGSGGGSSPKLHPRHYAPGSFRLFGRGLRQ